LANHLSCRHLTTLDLHLAKGEIAEPSWENPHLIVLQQRGLEHERAYIDSLRSKGLTVIDLSNEAEEVAAEAAWAAMKSGADAIVQATLESGDWRGRADVLLRVEQIKKPSRLGNWSYDPNPIGCLPLPPITASARGLYKMPLKLVPGRVSPACNSAFFKKLKFAPLKRFLHQSNALVALLSTVQVD
jgi:hypothetical protein